jgi:hypothetical protein
VFHSRYTSYKIDLLQELKKLQAAWRLGIMIRWWVHHPCHYNQNKDHFNKVLFEKLKMVRVDDKKS